MGARQQPTAFCAAGWGGRGVGGGRLLGRWPGIIWPALSGGLRGSDGDDAAGVELLQLPQQDGLTLARRFRDHDGMILRFATNLAVGFTSNQAERDVRPVKVQMRTSGGCWRTLEGLADFAIVQSCLSTAAKWGIDQLDALTQLFTDGPWLPAAIRPG